MSQTFSSVAVPDSSDFSLRPVSDQDRDRLLTWRNSTRVRRHMFTTAVIRADEHRRWFSRVMRESRDRHLVLQVDGSPIGFVSFSPVSTEDGATHWGIYIGEPDAPPGSGTALGQLALDYAFGSLGATTVVSEVMSDNQPAIRLYERLGFRSCGERRMLRDHGGAEETVIEFRISAPEWKSRDASGPIHDG